MKKLFLTLISISLLIVACSDEPPSIRISNQRTTKANVQIKLADANTVNINEIEPGVTTSYREIVDGATQATAVIQNEKESPAAAFSAAKNKNYTVIIQNSTPPVMKIDSSDK